MSKPAAISAQLVDMRNVGTHKSLKLTLHVPEEQALAAIEAFGWPTGANPVPVALARLNTESATEASLLAAAPTVAPRGAAGSDAAPRTPRPFNSLPLPQQAALLCRDPIFKAFCREELGLKEYGDDGPAEVIRAHTGVESRRQLRPDNMPGIKFINLRERYLKWKFTDAVA